MQAINWNDLRYVLALRRGRTLSGAANRLGVDDTTVSRRLAKLQAAIGVPICRRTGDGSLELTAAGEAAADRAEAIERHVDLIGEVAGEDAHAGTVRVTSVPILVNRLLVREVGALLREHPSLNVELIAESRDYSLTRREADLALRLARPRTGGTQVKARRIATLTYEAYVATGTSAGDAARLPWITYDDAMAHLPQARWMAKAARADRSGVAQIRVHDAETALEAALVGLGKTLLPSAIAHDDPRLQTIETGIDTGVPTREVWLLGHADQLPLPRVAAVAAWLARVASL